MEEYGCCPLLTTKGEFRFVERGPAVVFATVGMFDDDIGVNGGVGLPNIATV